MARPTASIVELFEIELPFVQAPMAGVHGSRLAIAVSNVGALGSLPGAMLSHDALRDELQAVRAGTTNSYNVNFFVHRHPEADPQADLRWRATLAPYYAELGVDPDDVPAGPARVPFDHQVADVVEEFRPPVVSFHFGLP
ncbi:MAG TPA: nitronate monooxygenase, partial [Ilumatobacteraceae bacterium]